MNLVKQKSGCNWPWSLNVSSWVGSANSLPFPLACDQQFTNNNSPTSCIPSGIHCQANGAHHVHGPAEDHAVRFSWAAPRHETSSRRGGPEQPPIQQRLDLSSVPSFRMDSRAAGSVIQNECAGRLVDSRIELSTRRSQHVAQLLLCR